MDLLFMVYQPFGDYLKLKAILDCMNYYFIFASEYQINNFFLNKNDIFSYIIPTA